MTALREAGPEDAGAIARLHADSWRRFYRGAFADSFLDGDVVADRQAVWSSRLATASPTRTLLAEDGPDLIGFVHIVVDEDERWGSLIDNLHVSHTHRGSGIGRALMTAVADGRRRYLWVLEQNVAAQGFYRALGGTEVERAAVTPPGGVPGRLNGSPHKLRFAWPGGQEIE